jgi:hypothetical protein
MACPESDHTLKVCDLDSRRELFPLSKYGVGAQPFYGWPLRQTSSG